MLVPWYLMASYAYYHRDESLLHDGTFDALCKRLDEEWDLVEHFHKHLIDRQDLAAGTCIRGEDWFPYRTRRAACALLQIPMRDLPGDLEHPHTKDLMRSFGFLNVQ